MTVPQFVMFTGTGAMKSFSCEVKLSDDRLLMNALPNDSHSPSSKTKSRSSCASPNVRGLREPRPVRLVGQDRGAVDRAGGLGRCREVDRVSPGRARPGAHLDGGDGASLFDPVLDQEVALRPERVDAVRTQRAGLVELEVHERGPGRFLHAGPEQVQEAGASGLRLHVGAEREQVALVVRDAARPHAGAGVVLLGPTAVGVVAGSGGQVVLARLADTRPVGRRSSVIDLQVRVHVDLEVAAGQARLVMRRDRRHREQHRACRRPPARQRAAGVSGDATSCFTPSVRGWIAHVLVPLAVERVGTAWEVRGRPRPSRRRRTQCGGRHGGRVVESVPRRRVRPSAVDGELY